MHLCPKSGSNLLDMSLKLLFMFPVFATLTCACDCCVFQLSFKSNLSFLKRSADVVASNGISIGVHTTYCMNSSMCG